MIEGGVPVDASSIGIPDINVGTRNGLAGVDIDVLNLEEDVDAITVQLLSHVFPSHLAPDVVRAVGDRGCEDGTGVSAEDCLLMSVGSVVQDTGLVVIDGLPFL